MSSAASWPGSETALGPFRITPDDIPPLNLVFAEAFTERYRRDGLVGVRVPPLNPLVWRYALADAADGAMLWRDRSGAIIAFNLAHRSGNEGWMGPLAVATPWQGRGLGREIVTAGLRKLEGCDIIGLETMPRTMDNIGFYSRLGMTPGPLTVALSFDAALQARHAPVLSDSTQRDELIAACGALTASQLPGVDFAREIRLTHELALGDTVLIEERGRIRGFAICHAAPLAEGRARDELRVLKCVLDDVNVIDELVARLADYARRTGCRRVSIRVQSEYPAAYRRLIALGARVRWTDLRMYARGGPRIAPGLGLSNWEI